MMTTIRKKKHKFSFKNIPRSTLNSRPALNSVNNDNKLPNFKQSNFHTLWSFNTKNKVKSDFSRKEQNNCLEAQPFEKDEEV